MALDVPVVPLSPAASSAQVQAIYDISQAIQSLYAHQSAGSGQQQAQGAKSNAEAKEAEDQKKWAAYQELQQRQSFNQQYPSNSSGAGSAGSNNEFLSSSSGTFGGNFGGAGSGGGFSTPEG